MPNKEPIQVTEAILDLNAAATLTSGNDYIIQHVGGSQVFRTNAASAPTVENISWNRLDDGDYISYRADANNVLWVRCAIGSAELAITDA